MTRAADRRRTRRRTALADHGIVSAHVRPGRLVALVDVSAGGALVDSPHRLLPGTVVELQLETETRRASMRGCVVRCCVIRVRSAAVCYRGAIAFDHHLAWFADAGDGATGRRCTNGACNG